MSKRPLPFSDVSDDAIVVLKSCFQFMDPQGFLEFKNQLSVPHPRVAKALSELRLKKLISYRRVGTTEIWSPMEGVDYRVLERIGYPKDAKFPLTIKINSQEYTKFKEELDTAVAKAKKPTKALARVLNDLSNMTIADLMKVQTAVNQLLNTK